MTPKKIGWYSKQQESRFGSVKWGTPGRSIVTVTAVLFEGMPYGFPDAECRGEVTYWISGSITEREA